MMIVQWLLCGVLSYGTQQMGAGGSFEGLGCS
jgi:hypothetical protein